MTDTTQRPTVRLRPKGPARAVRFGAPWVFADSLVMDRRTKSLKPGTIVRLEDADRTPLGTAGFNPASKIAIRVLDRDPDAQINQAWFEARIQAALDLRLRLFDTPHYRLIHAEADGLPGVIVDRFDDVLVLQPNAAWADAALDPLTSALCAVVGVKTVYKNASGRARGLEGLDQTSATLLGEVPARSAVPMNGALYQADILGGQKTGLFYDQRANHGFAARLAKGARVLDVFSHVGGFALACLAGGAAHALSVDSSAPALALAQEGAEQSGFADRFSTRKGDAFDTMDALSDEGALFDLVIADPPAFAPAKPALEAGLRAYERVARKAAGLVEPGGYLALCSCSHAADLQAFRTACLRGIGKAGKRAQLIHTGAAGPDHPTHPYLAESTYLKALFFRILP
ncbi:MAG: class I SAM-dependent rRNA methyltransferase [Pseudomonadota bacterium]